MRDQDEIYEAATEEPATLGCPSLVPGTVVVHDEPGAAAQQPQLKAIRPQRLDDIGMMMDKSYVVGKENVIEKIRFAGIRHPVSFGPAQLWEIVVSRDGDEPRVHFQIFKDHIEVVAGSVASGAVERTGDLAISMMIRMIIGNTKKKLANHYRTIRRPTATAKAKKGGAK